MLRKKKKLLIITNMFILFVCIEALLEHYIGKLIYI